MTTQREAMLTETLVELADTMVSDFDVVDFLSTLSARCVDLFGVAGSGVMLANEHGHMQLIASSSHAMRLLELLELQHDEGPCPDAYRTAGPIECTDLRQATQRWPAFAGEALDAGFRSAHALPMRLRTQIIGALNLLSTEPIALPAADLAAAQALTDVATIGILHQRAMAESDLMSQQLQYALTSRIVIEQAKGVIAQHRELNMDEAFTEMRGYSRRNNQRLADVARSIVERSLDPGTLGAR